MKRYLISPFILLLVINLAAQDSYFGINLGTSIPRNDFSASSSISTSGFAQNGFSIQFDGMFFPGSILGVGGLIGFGSIYPDGDGYLTSFMDYISQNPSFTGFNLPDRENYDISNGFWNYFNLMVGQLGPHLKSCLLGKIESGESAMAKNEFVEEENAPVEVVAEAANAPVEVVAEAAAVETSVESTTPAE